MPLWQSYIYHRAGARTPGGVPSAQLRNDDVACTGQVLEPQDLQSSALHTMLQFIWQDDLMSAAKLVE